LPSARRGDLQVATVWQPKGSRYERTVFTETLLLNSVDYDVITFKDPILGVKSDL